VFAFPVFVCEAFRAGYEALSGAGESGVLVVALSGVILLLVLVLLLLLLLLLMICHVVCQAMWQTMTFHLRLLCWQRVLMWAC